MGMNHLSNLRDKKGAVLVTVALLLVGLLSIEALALDVSSLLVTRNELQNAADAGALAATRVLYSNDGQSINLGANQVGVDAAKANRAENVIVELIGDPSQNLGDVQRGHWRWSDHTFTPNDNTQPTMLAGVTSEALDLDPGFINAVRVRVRRESTPAQSFLAGVMGYSGIPLQAVAVAYVGFAGSLDEAEADQPIAICEQALMNNGAYSCSTGRMINSNAGGETWNTGGWTNYTQGPCETASTPSVRPYVGCPHLPSPELMFGDGMGATGGEIQTVWNDFYDCWIAQADTDADGRPDQVLNMTLPVIDCPGNNVGNCATLVGAVNVNIVLMVNTNTNKPEEWAPIEMGGGDGIDYWSCPDGITEVAGDGLTEGTARACFVDFVNFYDLVNYQDVSINTFADRELNKSMFFLPDCDAHIPAGGTGGKNFGVLAKIPVLVN
jgi:Flp pilus assembly protein TadG